ncbi:MAG: serine protease [Bacteroidales bacterium]|nr:serine protease [Bacteroidales bacterium]
MYQKVWNKCYGGICVLNFFSLKGIRFESYTGFKYGRYLITTDEVGKIDRPYEVEIAFLKEDGLTTRESVKITYKDFKNRMIKGVQESYSGFALIDIDFPQFDNIPSLKLSNRDTFSVGAPIAIVGHQWEQNNLALKTGIISSHHIHQGKKMLMFDASMDRGNAGAPLIDAETCEVIGIIGQRLSIIHEEYKALMNVINANIESLKLSEGKLTLNDIDPIQVLIANQYQIKHLAQEVFRKASFTYGYALPVSYVCEFFDIAELEKDIVYINVENNKSNL